MRNEPIRNGPMRRQNENQPKGKTAQSDFPNATTFVALFGLKFFLRMSFGSANEGLPHQVPHFRPIRLSETGNIELSLFS